jgi:SET domain-containing protein
LGTRFVERRGRRYAVAPDVPLPRVERRRSGLHGWGVFALERIPKNKRIIAYLGELVSHEASVDRESRYLERGHIWCFKLSSRWVVDARHGGNDARFVNHACQPNCYSQVVDGTIWIRAARTIEPGEELTYDYHTDGDGLITCLCRPGCRTKL